MIDLNVIKTALTKLISGAFPYPEYKVFTEDLEQVELLQTSGESVYPLFHVQLSPLESELQMGAETKLRTVLADITFMEESKSTNAKIYTVTTKMEEILGAGFSAEDIFFHIGVVHGTVADDLLHITFQVEFTDVLPVQDDSEKFGELYISM